MHVKWMVPLAALAGGISVYYNQHQEASPGEASPLPKRVALVDRTLAVNMERRREHATAPGESALLPRTIAWDGIWLAKYPGVSPAQPDLDSDRDGSTNYDEMLAGTDPFNGRGSSEPNRQVTAEQSTPVSGPSWAESRTQLQQDAVTLNESAAREREEMLARAAATGTLLSLDTGEGRTISLAGFDPDGTPAYVGNTDIATADSIGADELWPANLVTAVSDWPTGGTGFNLNGGLSDPNDPDRPYPVISLWELNGAVRATHHQLNDLDATSAPRVIQYDADPPAAESDHASLVASIMAGSGASDVDQDSGVDVGNYSRGIAYGAQVHAYDTADIGAELSTEAALSPPLRAANHSYGLNVGWLYDSAVTKWRWFGGPTATEDYRFGAYTNGSSAGYSPRETDGYAVAGPYTLLVWAAGNDRLEGPDTSPPVDYYIGTGTALSSLLRDWQDGDEGGFDSLPPQGCAKNVLTVGASSDILTSWDAEGGVLSYSGSFGFFSSTSCGPTDDGRIKPDIVAPGVRVNRGVRNPLDTIGILGATAAADDAYGLATGTSLAAPAATGTVALMLQKRHAVCPVWENSTPYPIRSSTVKAMLIHTATDVDPAGPDFLSGYGLLNSIAAVKLMADDCVYAWNGGLNLQAPKPFVKEVYIKPGENFVEFKVSAQSTTVPLKVTLAWTDPQGAAQTGTTVDPQTKRLKHDLDLRVYVPGTTEFAPAADTCHKPWKLNPDLTDKTSEARSAPAVQGIPTSANDDTVNNVEQVVVSAPETGGQYIVRVTVKSTPTFSASGQWLSLALSGVTSPETEPFDVTGLSPGGQPGTYAITWDSTVGAIYDVEGSPDLVDWSVQSSNLSARKATTSTTVTSPPGVIKYFWRIARRY